MVVGMVHCQPKTGSPDILDQRLYVSQLSQDFWIFFFKKIKCFILIFLNFFFNFTYLKLCLQTGEFLSWSGCHLPLGSSESNSHPSISILFAASSYLTASFPLSLVLFSLFLFFSSTLPLVFFFIHPLSLLSTNWYILSHSYFLFHSSFQKYSHTLTYTRTLCVPCNPLSHKTCLSHFFPSACLRFLFVPFELPSVRGTRSLKCSCWSSFLSIVSSISVLSSSCLFALSLSVRV